jgi:nitrate/nitrite-specific signal transduction histidine kinase
LNTSTDIAPLEKKRSLQFELAFSFGVVIALVLALGLAFYFSSQRSAAVIDKTLTSGNSMADLSLRSAVEMYKTRAAEGAVLRSVDPLGAGLATEQTLPRMQAHLRNLRGHLSSIRSLSADPRIRHQVQQLESLLQQYEDGFLAFLGMHDREPGSYPTHSPRQAYVTAAVAIEVALEHLHAAATEHDLQARNAVERATRLAQWAAAAVVLMAALLAVAVATIVCQRITTSIGASIAFSRRVASGDYSARIAEGRPDEFGILARA